ncbi:Separin [Nosema granulosis]|uniref:separase n=1 Tax=Nosema granulosis TaxID=83296 RepID=A0A9P6H0J7_9MICR|nr:Separin [Nosema granulosis]
MFETKKDKDSVLNILSSKNNSERRLTYLKCIDYVNELLRKGYVDDYFFLVNLVKLMFKIKLKEIKKYLLEKALINICYKKFDIGLFKVIEKQVLKIKRDFEKNNSESELNEFANLFCPFGILKLKHTGVFHKNLEYFQKFCEKKFQLKIEQLTKKVCKNDVVDFCSIYEEFKDEFKGDLKTVESDLEEYDTQKYFNLRVFCSSQYNFQEMGLLDLRTTKIFQNNLERDMQKALICFLERRFTEAKCYLKGVKQHDLFIKYSEIRFHVYNLLIQCHLECAEYFDCLYYIALCVDLSTSLELDLVYFYFLNLIFAIERIGGIKGPTSCLKNVYKEPFFKDITSLDEQGINTILRDCKLKTQLVLSDVREDIRELRNIETKKPVTLKGLFTKQKMASEAYKVISIYTIDGFIYINLFDKIVETKIDFTEISNRLSSILTASKDVLKRHIETINDKAEWWLDRIELDNRLRRLLKEINPEIEILNEHVILVLDEKSTNFPWEHTAFLKDKHVYRIPSLEFLENREIITTVESISWIVDPENNLEGTRKRITNFLSQKNFNKDEENFKVLLYFGHGGGSKYLKNIKNKILFLFGCCSSRILNITNFKRNGKAIDHLIRGNTLIGCLWEVTDKDLDLISMKIIDSLFSGRCIACIVKEAIGVSKLKYLNGCSLVVYGVPTVLKSYRNN